MAIGLTLFGLACSSAAALAAGVSLLPFTPGRLAYYALLAGASTLRLAGLAAIGCALAVPALLRRGRPEQRVAIVALGLGALAAGVSSALVGRVYLTTRRLGLPWSLTASLFGPTTGAGLPPERVTFAAGESWRLDADLYRPVPPISRGRLTPAVVVVHGGAWQRGDKGENPMWNRWLTERGYLVLDIQYRLAPGAGWREAVQDIRGAIAWLRARADDLGADPNRIALLGRSAGGHLALLAAYANDHEPDQPDPSCVVAFYAPTDVRRLYVEARRTSANDLRAGLRATLGVAPFTGEEAYRLASPLARLHPRVPPTLLVHGAWDSVVPPDHSLRLASALEHVGVPSRFVCVPFARHAFDLVPYGPATMLAREAVFAFLANVGSD